MGILQSRVIVRAKPGKWDEARRIARLQVADANTRSGTLAYEIYQDEPEQQLINIASYASPDAWLTHSKSNPHAKGYMEVCEVVSIEIHGAPSAELRALIETYGAARTYLPVP